MPDMVPFAGTQKPARIEHGGRRVWIYAVIYAVICAVLVALSTAWWCLTQRDHLQLPAVVTSKEGDFARRSFIQQYGRNPDHMDLLSWLAEWYLARGRLAAAVDCFDEIPTSHPFYGRMARFQQGRTLLTLHRAIPAEDQFRELIEAEEQAPAIVHRYLIDARQRLRHILEVELRFEERQSLVRGVVERGEEADGSELVTSLFPSQMRWNGPQATEWLDQFYAVDPHHPILRAAKGRYLTGEGKLQEARQILEDLVREYPADLRARTMLIACLREADAPDEVDRQMRLLPPRSTNDSWLLLLLRGDHALQNGQAKEAAAAYEQVLQTDRTSSQAWQGVANAARQLGDVPRREQAVKMAAGLGRIQNHLGKGIQRGSDPNSFLDVADLCAEIGLDQEGWILTRYALKLAPKNSRALGLAQQFRSRLPATKSKNPRGN